MVLNFFDKKCSDEAIKYDIMPKQQLAEKKHKPIII